MFFIKINYSYLIILIGATRLLSHSYQVNINNNQVVLESNYQFSPGTNNHINLSQLTDYITEITR